MQKKNKEGRLGPLGNRGLSRRGRERSKRAHTGQDTDARAHRLARPRLPVREADASASLCPFVRPFAGVRPFLVLRRGPQKLLL